jgi:hypothetical protein
MKPCAREGCKKLASRDEFCSTECAKAHHIGVEEPQETERERRNRVRRINRLRKKFGASVTIANPDAMAHLAPGSAGSAPRHHQKAKPST